MLYLLIKELDLTPIIIRLIIIVDINDRIIRSYHIYNIYIRITDSWDNAKETTYTFHAVKSIYFLIILSYPWLRKEDPYFR
jgi:hypothetical protein